MVNKNSMLRVILLMVIALLSACVDKPENSQALTPEQMKALEIRVEERWQARIAHDWGAAWEYRDRKSTRLNSRH